MLRSFAASFSLLGLACLSCQSTAPAATSRPAAPAAPLFETRWVVRQLRQQRVAVPEGGQEAYLLLRRTGAAEGQGSCNRFRSSAFTDSTSHLTFSPLLSTRMACPALATEQAFTQALAATQCYRISGDTLRLYATAEPGAVPLARLEAVYLH
ncbi:MAG: META domain-containing protein [Cytophagaceae bacterium]|nr:MAG: META domain-containing protein [Cytophagaceae bacterium]